jgi:ATP-dependent exoDNAse (exonuclease V) beta subunit
MFRALFVASTAVINLPLPQRMKTQVFSIYRSSAGSGKTRTLAREYLRLALRHKAGYFRHILAVTFTNKATQEMKDRILLYLDDFAHGRPNDLANELMSDLKLDEATFRENSQQVLSSILHDYSQFSICTIDAFFQRVIRAFTREAELTGDYRLEVESEPVLDAVVNQLIDNMAGDRTLTSWVVEFASENLVNDRAWDVRKSLAEFSKEILKEEFRSVAPSVKEVTKDRQHLIAMQSQLRQLRDSYIEYITTRARHAVKRIQSEGLSYDDFKYKGSSVFRWFEGMMAERKVSGLHEKTMQTRPQGEYQDPVSWPSKSINAARVLQLARELVPLLKEVVSYAETHAKAAFSAEAVLNDFYAFGLLGDISKELREYKSAHGVMLLAEAPEFLNNAIGGSDTPFVYEKMGSRFRNFLIDEFQDTSGMQWKNLLPLIMNGLDQGYNSVVVGDVKQAIYRWRGGDLRLLQEEVEQHVGPERVTEVPLNYNYRSSPVVVGFNNRLFKVASRAVALQAGHPLPEQSYYDVNQNVGRDVPGFVRIQFIQSESDQEGWKEQALNQVPRWLEELQDAGVKLKDIAILVRKNEEGHEVVSHLMAYRNSATAREDCKYDAMSNETLRLDVAGCINLLLAALRYLHNPSDAVARAQLSYEYARAHGANRSLNDVFDVSNQTFLEAGLPPAFGEEKAALKKLPLYELTETLIGIFGLGQQTGELAYLQAFQDLVLEFYSQERNDLGAFLEWWEEHGKKKSLAIPDEVDAVRVFTIHKSKGLQFKYVLIPFCSWALNHESRAPYLWVHSNEEPFNQLGYIPVVYKSGLKNTYFAEAYETERARCLLDNLNLLYVAFTRAEQGLLVSAPHEKGKVAGLLLEVLRDESLSGGWKEEDTLWEEGTLQFVKKEPEDRNETLRLLNYEASRWRDKLVIRHTAEHYFGEGEESAAQRFGVHMHSVLSRIRTKDEFASALTAMVQEGLINPDERTELESQLSSMFNDAVIGSWFTDPWVVRTEVSVLLPGGAEKRIDRLLTNGHVAIIIDYKTGKPLRKDHDQVLAYMEVLQQMNFHKVEGYLLYLPSLETVSVRGARLKKSRLKDESQLELGLM